MSAPPQPPAAVHRLMGTHHATAWGQAPHRDDIQAAAAWVVQAVRVAHRHEDTKTLLRRLLGSPSFTLCLTWATSFTTITEGSRAILNELGQSLDRIFQSENLRESIGSYHAPMLAIPDLVHGDRTTPSPLRQDAFLTFLDSLPAAESGAPLSPLPGAEHMLRTHEAEVQCIHVLRLIAKALDAAFVEAVNAAAREWLSTPVVAHGIKGYPRMFAKMFSRDDHLHEAFPRFVKFINVLTILAVGPMCRAVLCCCSRPAMNVDIVRCLAVFEDAAAMRSGLDAFCDRFGGGYCKFKNGMCWSNEEAAARHHLRLVMATVVFEHPDYPTIGALRNCPDISTIWNNYLDPSIETIPEECNPLAWQRQALAARQWLEQLPADTPIRMACEIQCLLSPYHEVRSEMHEPYRLVRAANDQALYRDFQKYSKAAAQVASYHLHGSNPFLRACRDGDLAWLEAFLLHQKELAQQRLSGSANPPDNAASNIDKVPPCSEAEAYASSQSFQFGDVIDGMSIAAEYGHPLCVARLIKAVSTVRFVARGSDIVHEGDMDVAKVLALEGPIKGFPLLCAALGNPSRRYGPPTGLHAPARESSIGWQRTEVVRLLIDAKANVNQVSVKGDGGVTALAMTAQCNFANGAKLLLASKAYVSQRNPVNGATALHTAAQYDSAEVLDLLLDAQAEIDAKRTDTGDTPLLAAVHNNCRASVARLLCAKADASIVRKLEGTTPVFIAAANNLVDVLELLLEAHASAESHCSSTGTSAAWIATQLGHCEALKLLLEAGANPNTARVSDGIPATCMAVQVAGAIVSDCANGANMGADCNPGAVCLAQLLEAKASANASGVNGMSPLFMASQHTVMFNTAKRGPRTASSCLEMLLTAKAHLDTRATSSAFSPLMTAVQKQSHWAIKLLLAHKADVAATELSAGFSPLHFAAAHGTLQSAEQLLSAKANINQKSEGTGATPLHIAIQRRAYDIVDSLVRHKANVNAVAGSAPMVVGGAMAVGSSTVLSMAASQAIADNDDCSLRATTLLLECKANVNACIDPSGTHLAWMAAYHGQVVLLQQFMKHGLDVNVRRPTDDTTPLFAASQSGQLQAVEFLLKSKADPNMTSAHFGMEPIVPSCMQGHVLVLRQLLAAKAEPDVLSTTSKNTALCAAASTGNAQCLSELLTAKALVNRVRGGDSLNPVHLAAKGGHLQCLRLLLASHADANIAASVPCNQFPGVNKRAERGPTALFLAAMSAHPECLDSLLQAKADAAASCAYGTAVEAAVDSGSELCVASLLAAKGTPSKPVLSTPALIQSAAHSQHKLELTSSSSLPQYALGFTCDICGIASLGQFYHCGQCNWDAHIRCALTTVAAGPGHNSVAGANA